MTLSWFRLRAGQASVTELLELAGRADENSRRKVQNVVTDSTAVPACKKLRRVPFHMMVTLLSSDGFNNRCYDP